MEIKSLDRFIAVADELHFGRAAEKLHIVESALSRQIQRLESELQFDLFDRTNRRVQLTPAGALFLGQMRSLVASFDSAVNLARRTAEGKAGFIRVGFIGSATCEILPSVLRAFREQWPEVELELSEMASIEQLQNLQQKRLDIGFIRGPIPSDPAGLAFETVAREPLAVALPRNHPLTKRTRVRTGALANETFILSCTNKPNRSYPTQLMSNWEILFRKICLKAGFEPKITQRTTQINTAISLVSEGIGIAIVPMSAKNLPQRGVVYRPLEEKAVLELLAAYRNGEDSQVLRNFLKSVREVERKRETRETWPLRLASA
jgi:DNA-binding transcriptional LysR family regulator